MKRPEAMALAVVLLSALMIMPGMSMAQGTPGDARCLVYFTALGCPNCAVTDPIVLEQWTSENEDLVVLEYMFYDWGDENAAILGAYAQTYGTLAAVPQLFISSERILSGRLDIPNLDTGSIPASNPCLVGDAIEFGNLDLNAVFGNLLKVWANGRLLVRTGQGQVSNDFLKELLFTSDVQSVLDSQDYEIQETDPDPAPISGGQVVFEKAFSIGDSWTFQFNESAPAPGGNQTQNGSGNVAGNNTIVIPIFGEINIEETPLPVLTVIIGLADGFNPCAFFILTFLLAAMVAAASRKRILAVGGIFLFFSALIYFLFMSAWLNVFLLGAEIMLFTLFAGIVALVAGIINVKDFFFFKKGVSLTLPKKDKLKMTQRVNNLINRADSFKALVAGTIIIAVTVNLYELLCTLGFPIVYTRILTLQNLSGFDHYLYLVLYNVMYVVPLAIIVAVFAISLGSMKFGEEGVKNLKLISGLMILQLGASLLINPKVVENAGFMFLFVFSAIVVGLVLIFAKKALMRGRKGGQNGGIAGPLLLQPRCRQCPVPGIY